MLFKATVLILRGGEEAGQEPKQLTNPSLQFFNPLLLQVKNSDYFN